MGLFNNRNANEAAYVGGKKHFLDILKNQSPNEDELIWRLPEEDFNNNSQLVVMPGEWAVFINRGNVEKVFENGTYTLNTQNYPFLSRLRNSLSGGVSAFNCVVYFVRSAISKEIRFGTQSPLDIRDNIHLVRTKVRVRATYKYRVEDPSLFITKVFGNKESMEQAGLNEFFGGELQAKIKSTIAKYLNSLQRELVGIDAYLEDISDEIKPKINEIFEENGIKCVSFSLVALDVDDYGAYDEKVHQALADGAAMGLLGENWGRQQAANILTNISKNPGSGAGDFAGLGAGIAAGGAIGSMAQAMFAPMTQQAVGSIQNTNQQNKQQTGEDDDMEKLRKLKTMLEAELISQEEYDSKKAEILSRM